MQTLEALIDPIRRSPPRMEAASCCDARLNSSRIDGANFIRKWHLNKRPNSSTARWSCIRPPAIANHWPIPPETLAAVPERMLGFVENGSRREATAAARVLVAMARHNAELGLSDSVHSHLHAHLHPAGDESKTMGLEEVREQNRRRIERPEKFTQSAN